MNSEVNAVVFSNWTQYLYDLTDFIFWCTYFLFIFIFFFTDIFVCIIFLFIYFIRIFFKLISITILVYFFWFSFPFDSVGVLGIFFNTVISLGLDEHFLCLMVLLQQFLDYVLLDSVKLSSTSSWKWVPSSIESAGWSSIVGDFDKNNKRTTVRFD